MATYRVIMKTAGWLPNNLHFPAPIDIHGEMNPQHTELVTLVVTLPNNFWMYCFIAIAALAPRASVSHLFFFSDLSTLYSLSTVHASSNNVLAKSGASVCPAARSNFVFKIPL